MALRRAGVGAAAIGALALLIALWRLGVGDPLTDALEDRFYDLRMRLRGPLPPPASVALVTIDEPSVAAIGMGAPMRRAVAEAVDILQREGAVAVGIDLLLVERTEADPRLAAALAAMPGAILAIASLRDAVAKPPSAVAERALARAAFRTILRRHQGVRPVETVALPEDALAAVARLGHVNLLRDPDRVSRRVPLALPAGDGLVIPALPLVAARLALGLPAQALRYEAGERVMLGDHLIETDNRGSVAIVHRGRAGTIHRIALDRVLEGALPAGGVAGRVVLIGASAESLGDIGATPLDADVPGVETLAAVTAQLIEGRVIIEGRTAAIATVTLSLAAALLAWRAALIAAAPTALLGSAALWAAVLLVIAYTFIAADVMLDATAILGALAAATASGWSFSRLRDQRETARLAPHVTPLLDRLNSTEARGPMAVVFADMVGSTSRASNQDAEATARMITAVHARIATVTERHGGLVAEVLGDGALVVFGPGPDPGTAARAGMAAVMALAGGTPALRVTAHFGPVALAELGTARQRHITLAGDTVNVAARLQDEARRRGTRLLVSAALVSTAGMTRGLKPAEPALLRGVKRPVAVYLG